MQRLADDIEKRADPNFVQSIESTSDPLPLIPEAVATLPTAIVAKAGSSRLNESIEENELIAAGDEKAVPTISPELAVALPEVAAPLNRTDRKQRGRGA
jgi:hypothetical protein